MKPIAYIVGPYRAKTKERIEENIQKAAKVAKQYWAEGFTVICPHTNSAHFSGCCPESFFLESYKDLLSCGLVDRVIALPGWLDSKGSQAELILADEQGILIEYVV